MIQAGRIKLLNTKKVTGGSYVLYWMQASQRSEYNHALEFAVRKADELNLPLVVYFGLTCNYPEANLRYYLFMLQGLEEVKASLEQCGIKMVVRQEPPDEGAVKMSENAALVVCDRGYLAFQRRWRKHASRKISAPCLQVESDVVVPVEEASSKEEYSAATLRPKIYKKLPQYLAPLEARAPKNSSLSMEFEGLLLKNTNELLKTLDIDMSVMSVDLLTGGNTTAKTILRNFIEQRLDSYSRFRNDPVRDVLSGMSPYLHFGQISPLAVALEVARVASPGTEAYLEELIVRRELSMNFVYYNSNYHSFHGLPAWASRVLREREIDSREYIYSLEELEKAKTHDQYWNAAQKEMVLTGKMHGYMRMYWGKKIIEWSAEPVEAFRRCIYLNNKYQLDGRDPNSYAGVAWCFGKHDRPWAARPVFGSVRYMNARGLKRKFDIDTYALRFG